MNYITVREAMRRVISYHGRSTVKPTFELYRESENLTMLRFESDMDPILGVE